MTPSKVNRDLQLGVFKARIEPTRQAFKGHQNIRESAGCLTPKEYGLLIVRVHLILHFRPKRINRKNH